MHISVWHFIYKSRWRCAKKVSLMHLYYLPYILRCRWTFGSSLVHVRNLPWGHTKKRCSVSLQMSQTQCSYIGFYQQACFLWARKRYDMEWNKLLTHTKTNCLRMTSASKSFVCGDDKVDCYHIQTGILQEMPVSILTTRSEDFCKYSKGKKVGLKVPSAFIVIQKNYEWIRQQVFRSDISV